MGASSRRFWVFGLALGAFSFAGAGSLAAQQAAKAPAAKPAATAKPDAAKPTAKADAAKPAAAPEKAPAPAAAPDPELTQFAKAYMAIGLIRDDYEAQMALSKNKTVEIQTQLKEDYKKKVEAAVQAAGLTMNAYHRIEYSVSVDGARRAALDQILAAANG